MNKRTVRRRSGVLLMILIFALVVCVPVGAIDWFGGGDPAGTDRETSEEGGSTYTAIAQNGMLELRMAGGKGRFQVEDLRSGRIWKCWSSAEIEDSEAAGYSYIRSNVESALMCTYFDKNAAEAIYDTVYTDECSQVQINRCADGADVIYTFDELSLSVLVEYRLREDALEVTIPAEGIVETGEYLFQSIAVAPYFGSGKDTEQGYVLLPDGCGTLVRFKEDHPRYSSFYEGSIYGKDTVMVEEDIYSDEKAAALPVYGIRSGDDGFLCDIREGDADTSIVCWPSGYRMNVTSAYVQFTLRRAYYATLSNASTAKKFETCVLTQDFRAAYTFLPKGEADYSAMAVRYREQLRGSGRLPQALTAQPRMVLNIFMAAEEPRLIGSDHVKVTTFLQAEEMLRDLTDSGAKDLAATVLGWTDHGYAAYPNRFPIPSALGGTDGSRALGQFAEEHGVALYYADNYVNADKSNASVSMKNVVYQGNGLIPETDRTKKKYLFSPRYLSALFAKERTGYVKAHINGILFEKLGQMTYFDHNPRYESISRVGTSEVFREMLSDWKKAGGQTAVQGGNAYLLAQADLLTDIPAETSGYFFADESVPFYQMVVHGCVAYTGTPINRFGNGTEEYLRMVEYGYVPSFALSWDDPAALLNTRYNRLFSSCFSQNRDRILQAYEDQQRLQPLQSAAMVEHVCIQSGIYRVRYANGMYVYVNYTDALYEQDEISVPAHDFAVIG